MDLKEAMELIEKKRELNKIFTKIVEKTRLNDDDRSIIEEMNKKVEKEIESFYSSATVTMITTEDGDKNVI